MLAYAETHKYPFSVSEVLTGGVVPYNAANFSKPVLVCRHPTYPHTAHPR